MACGIEQSASILVAAYGAKRWRPHGDPLDELVGTVLSQHTSDINTARAFRSLRARFPTWTEVRDAPTAEVADAIRCGGLAETKAPRIQRILRELTDTGGTPALPDLCTMPLPDAKSALTRLSGVGPKTAACVLLFALGRPAMPVDTHVHRVAMRLGLIPPGASAEAAHSMLETLVGADRDRIYAFHLNAIAHGRNVCVARAPRCGSCPLQECCDFYAANHQLGA
jgi:endonuclease-3